MTQTFYWHDYETWGVNPALDKPAQFAGIRTDADLNVVGEPLNILCKPTLDTLPHIEAALITGINPQQAADNGLLEREFFAAIHNEFARPQTCGVGYNSIRFDDEVTRYGLYRNFYDPYAREWQSGCSRWDIIDMVRLCYAVRPEGIEWPKNEKGQPSFRLEKLTEVNGIAHEGAHDALSDVLATIELAKLIKMQQPKLYQHVLDLRTKAAVQNVLEVGSYKPKLHISSRFGSAFSCASIILPIAVNPKNKNEIICVDLRYSPEPLLELTTEKIIELQFTPVAELPKGIERIPLKSVHLNRSPVVLSPGLVDDGVAEKIKLNLSLVESHRQQIKSQPLLVNKLIDVYTQHRFTGLNNDVDAQLYDGFIPNNDRNTARPIPSLNGQQLQEHNFVFEDARLNELLFRYRARNFEDTLNEAERQQWYEYCAQKLAAQGDGNAIARELEKIAKLKKEKNVNGQTLSAVESYIVALNQRLSTYL